jgi:hypothetical protein
VKLPPEEKETVAADAKEHERARTVRNWRVMDMDCLGSGFGIKRKTDLSEQDGELTGI